jgi:hypothetical protein
VADAEEEARLEEENRLRLVAEEQARNVRWLEEQYGNLTNKEVVAAVVSRPDHVVAPLVMNMRLIAAIGQLEKRLKSTERLTWALVFLTFVLLVVTVALLLAGD